jgi:hypothetical protein
VSTFGYFEFLLSFLPQLRFKYVPCRLSCIVKDPNIVELTFIVTLVTDILLLFIVLLGLFRLGRGGGGSFGLRGLLWKQVWHCLFPSTVVRSANRAFLLVRELPGSCLPPWPRSCQWYVLISYNFLHSSISFCSIIQVFIILNLSGTTSLVN